MVPSYYSYSIIIIIICLDEISFNHSHPILKDRTLTVTSWVKVNLGVMTMKGYSIFPRAPELELHQCIHFSLIFSAQTQLS